MSSSRGCFNARAKILSKLHQFDIESRSALRNLLVTDARDRGLGRVAAPSDFTITQFKFVGDLVSDFFCGVHSQTIRE